MTPTTTTEAAESANESVPNVELFSSDGAGDPEPTPEMVAEMNQRFLDSPKIQAAMIDGAFQTALLKALTGEPTNIEKLLGNYKKWAEIEAIRNR